MCAATGDLLRHVLGAFALQGWVMFGFGVLALVAAAAWTWRYSVHQYVESRRDLARLDPGGPEGDV